MSDNRRVGQRNSASSDLRSSPSRLLYVCCCHVYTGLAVCIRVCVCVHASTDKGRLTQAVCDKKRVEDEAMPSGRNTHPTSTWLLSHTILFGRRFGVRFAVFVDDGKHHPSPMFLFCNVILRLKIRFRSVWTTSFSRRKVETGIWKKIVIDKLRHSHIRNIFSFLPQYYWDISHYRLIAFIVNVNFYLVLYLNSKLYVYIYLLQRYTFNNRIRIKAVNARILSFC